MTDAHAKYRQTEKGKAAMKRAKQRYAKSEKGSAHRKAKRKEYMQTENGKAARKRQDAARLLRRMAARPEPERQAQPQPAQIYAPRIPSLSEMIVTAANYKIHGWPTVDQAIRQNHDDRLKDYESALQRMLDKFTQTPTTCADIAKMVDVPEGTAKKYVAVLFKRGLIDRKQLGKTYFYFRP